MAAVMGACSRETEPSAVDPRIPDEQLSQSEWMKKYGGEPPAPDQASVPIKESDLPADMVPSGEGQLYAFTNPTGAIGTFRLPSERSDYCVEVNEYLSRTYATHGVQFEPYDCVTILVDNREGYESMGMYGIQLVDDAGNTYDSTSTTAMAVDDPYWDPAKDAEGNTKDRDLYNEGVALYNGAPDFRGYSVGEKGESTRFFAELPAEEPRYVHVMSGGAWIDAEAQKVAK